MVTRFPIEPLPPRPSLEHQQKLAKRLLREVWAEDPDAVARVQAFLPGRTNPESMKLHDTQLVVARGYGFDSWASMKRKIESLTQSPLEQFDVAVREGDAGRARELLAKHRDIRARVNDPASTTIRPRSTSIEVRASISSRPLDWATYAWRKSVYGTTPRVPKRGRIAHLLWARGCTSTGGPWGSISLLQMLRGNLGIRRW